jgi:hypothetical protein
LPETPFGQDRLVFAHVKPVLSFGLRRANCDIYNVVTNRYEVMALDAQSHTTAFDAAPGVGNVNRNVDLTRTSPTAIFPFAIPRERITQNISGTAQIIGDSKVTGPNFQVPKFLT